MVGLVTLVTMRVESVTSTSFLVSFGDMRTYSGPMLPVSSGALPGHSSTTIVLSAASAGQAMHDQAIRATAGTKRFMVAPLCDANSTGTRRVLLGMLPVGPPNSEVSHARPSFRWFVYLEEGAMRAMMTIKWKSITAVLAVMLAA